jgi:hypothetical protein
MCRFFEEIMTGGIEKEGTLRTRGQDPLDFPQPYNKSDTNIGYKKGKN